MKRIRALASLFLAAMMLALLTFPAAAAAGHQAYMNGYGNGVFGPDRAMTRAETITVLARLYGRDADGYASSCSYVDVPTDNWAAPYVGYAQSMGYLDKVYGRVSTFNPDAPITRAEFVVLLIEFTDTNIRGTSTVGRFNDTASHWAAAYINYANDKGWVNGVGDNDFAPEDSLTRAQICAIINRMSGRTCDDIPNATRFTDVSTGHWAYRDIMEASTTH